MTAIFKSKTKWRKGIGGKTMEHTSDAYLILVMLGSKKVKTEDERESFTTLRKPAEQRPQLAPV